MCSERYGGVKRIVSLIFTSDFDEFMKLSQWWIHEFQLLFDEWCKRTKIAESNWMKHWLFSLENFQRNRIFLTESNFSDVIEFLQWNQLFLIKWSIGSINYWITHDLLIVSTHKAYKKSNWFKFGINLIRIQRVNLKRNPKSELKRNFANLKQIFNQLIKPNATRLICFVIAFISNVCAMHVTWAETLELWDISDFVFPFFADYLFL